MREHDISADLFHLIFNWFEARGELASDRTPERAQKLEQSNYNAVLLLHRVVYELKKGRP
jgi:hypothetical protein